jgi:hypothetical protein
MKSRFHNLAILSGAVLGALSAGSAFAVASYGNLDATQFSTTAGGANCQDGVYAGTGCSIQNGNFTIDRSGGIEVGLRAKNRLDFTLIDGSTGTYHAPVGKSSLSRAMWNYEFSVNTQQGGGALTLNDVSVMVRVDTDAGAGVSFGSWLDVFANWGDNAYTNGSGVRVGAGPAQTGEFGVQQSVNPLFGNSGFMPGFNPNGAGTYEIELAVFGLNDNRQTDFRNVLAGTDITVQVPEPGTLALLGLSLAGMAALRRRKTTAV